MNTSLLEILVKSFTCKRNNILETKTDLVFLFLTQSYIFHVIILLPVPDH